MIFTVNYLITIGIERSKMKRLLFVMKRPHVMLLIAAIFLLCTCALMDISAQSQNSANSKQYGMGNPYLPLWEHLPDGEPRVFEDPDNPGKYRIYIIGSHDVRATSYCGPDIRSWSAPVEDLSNWRDEGPIFTYNVSNQWET